MSFETKARQRRRSIKAVVSEQSSQSKKFARVHRIPWAGGHLYAAFVEIETASLTAAASSTKPLDRFGATR